MITYQEEDRISDCLRSLSLCDEIVVVDSGSTDRTVGLAGSAGARVIVRTPFPGHREQKQFAVEQAQSDWVLCLDADERLSDELQERIRRLLADGLAGAAYEMPRRNRYLGKVVRRGLSWPDRKVRLFDRRQARWGGRNPHDRVEVDPGGEITRLDEPIEHLSYRSFKDHLRNVDEFTAISALALWQEGRRTSPLDLLFRPPFVVLKSLVFKRGFMDGWRGVSIALMAGYYDWLKYWRLFRMRARANP